MKHATQWKNMKIYIIYVPFKFELEIVKNDILFYNSMQYFKIILCYLYYSS